MTASLSRWTPTSRSVLWLLVVVGTLPTGYAGAVFGLRDSMRGVSSRDQRQRPRHAASAVPHPIVGRLPRLPQGGRWRLASPALCGVSSRDPYPHCRPGVEQQGRHSPGLLALSRGWPGRGGESKLRQLSPENQQIGRKELSLPTCVGGDCPAILGVACQLPRQRHGPAQAWFREATGSRPLQIAALPKGPAIRMEAQNDAT